MVSWEQRVMVGDPKFEASQDLPAFNYAAYAQMLGLGGVRIETEDQIVPGLQLAFASKMPVVIDVLADPSVPPLPPHITLKQAKAFGSAVLKGDVNAWDMIRQTYKEVVDNYFHHTT
jgi:pyruvate dehydrogenase (quinone)